MILAMDVLRSVDAGSPVEPLELSLVLEPSMKDGTVAYVEGSVRHASHPAREFRGWLELLQVLEDVVADREAPRR
jgi:hypothetical protein